LSTLFSQLGRKAVITDQGVTVYFPTASQRSSAVGFMNPALQTRRQPGSPFYVRLGPPQLPRRRRARSSRSVLFASFAIRRSTLSIAFAPALYAATASSSDSPTTPTDMMSSGGVLIGRPLAPASHQSYARPFGSAASALPRGRKRAHYDPSGSPKPISSADTPPPPATTTSGAAAGPRSEISFSIVARIWRSEM
jgi:hypothetical protein